VLAFGFASSALGLAELGPLAAIEPAAVQARFLGAIRVRRRPEGSRTAPCLGKPRGGIRQRLRGLVGLVDERYRLRIVDRCGTSVVCRLADRVGQEQPCGRDIPLLGLNEQGSHDVLDVLRCGRGAEPGAELRHLAGGR